jgi:hypothetical protein
MAGQSENVMLELCRLGRPDSLQGVDELIRALAALTPSRAGGLALIGCADPEP